MLAPDPGPLGADAQLDAAEDAFVLDDAAGRTGHAGVETERPMGDAEHVRVIVAVHPALEDLRVGATVDVGHDAVLDGADHRRSKQAELVRRPGRAIEDEPPILG